MLTNDKQSMPFPPLPAIPDFAVYGLGPGYRGARWLALWNPPQGPLTEIDLGHGNTDTQRRATIVVVTCANDQDLMEQARGKALLYLAHAQPEGALASSLQPFLADLIRDVRPDIGWLATLIPVDGELREAQVYRHAVGWAAAINLGKVTIGVFGNGMELPSQGLSQVNDSINEYAAAI